MSENDIGLQLCKRQSVKQTDAVLAFFVCPKCLAVFGNILRETPMESARGFDEKFGLKFCVEKRRNTVCISSFSQAEVGAKEPSKPAGDFFGVSQRKAETQ